MTRTTLSNRELFELRNAILNHIERNCNGEADCLRDLENGSDLGGLIETDDERHEAERFVELIVAHARLLAAREPLDPCDLDELLELLNSQDPRCFDDYNGDCKSPSTDLPTFGGPGPDDTLGVWSWDATHQIVHNGADKFEIVSRA